MGYNITIETTARARPDNCGCCMVYVEDGELCWWCHHILCASCHNRIGHCGHVEAERINEQSREARNPEEAFEVFYFGMLRAGKDPGEPVHRLRARGTA